MPRIGLVGPTYPSLSLAADAERCVNWYPELVESGVGKNRYLLVNTPGYSTFATLGAGPGRGLLTTNTGRCFAISGNILYEVAFNAGLTNRGTLALSTGMCTISQGQTQVLIVEGVFSGGGTGHAWIFDLNANTLTDVTASLALEPLMGGYVDGFFVVLGRNTSKFQISKLLDGTTWNALDVAEVSFFPDGIVGMTTDHREIWLAGTKNTAVYWDSGNADFPFIPSTQASIQHGWLSPFSAQRLDNTLFWLGINEQGRGVVYRANGYLPQRVSNYAVENALLQYAKTHPGNDSLAGAFAYTYLEAGHSFYVLTVPGMETSWAYDVGTQLWHERGVWSGSAFTARTESIHAYGLDRHLYQNTQNGILAEGSITIGDAYGAGVQRMRRAPHQSDENLWALHAELEIQVDADPVRNLNLRWSDDAVNSWSTSHTLAAGAASRFAAGQRARFRRLGRTRDRVYELTCNDVTSGTPAQPTRIIDAYLRSR